MHTSSSPSNCRYWITIGSRYYDYYKWVTYDNFKRKQSWSHRGEPYWQSGWFCYLFGGIDRVSSTLYAGLQGITFLILQIKATKPLVKQVFLKNWLMETHIYNLSPVETHCTSPIRYSRENMYSGEVTYLHR